MYSIILLQLSGNTSDFSALNHQVEITEYSEVPYSRPVFFPSMKISREKNGIYSVDESMRAGDERKFEKITFQSNSFSLQHTLNH